MLKKVAGHLNYASVMATIAVFLAMGGGAYAAMSWPANSVGALQLKKNSVGASELKPGSITPVDVKASSLTPDLFKKETLSANLIKTGAIGSSEVLNGSLKFEDFARDQLPPGPRGPAGTTGPPGPKGETGAPPAVEGFKSVDLRNGFVQYDEYGGGPDVPVRYYKDPFGIVHIEGVVERSSTPPDFTTIFQLPPGYRPAGNYYLSFPTLTTGHNDTDEQLGYIQVEQDGNVDYVGGKVGYLSLTGVSFRAG